MEDILNNIKLKINTFNQYNKKINEENNIEENNIEENVKEEKEEVVEQKYEKKEKDIIRAFKLLKAKYDVKQNKYANFNIDDKTNNLVDLKDLDIENTEKIYTWSKLPKENKELLIDKVVNIERIKNKLDEESCIELKELLLKNDKNIMYHKQEKVIIGYKNLLYIVSDNKKKYIFNNVINNSLTNKLSRKVYNFV